MRKYFPEPKRLGERVKVEWNLSDYAANTDIKNAIRVNTSKFNKRADLANLESNVNKLDFYKLKNVPSCLSSLKSKVDELDIWKVESTTVDLSKQSNAVKSGVFKKIEYNAKIKSIEDKIPDVTSLATSTTLNVKINRVKGKIPNITNLATNTALTAVEHKTPNIS